MRRFSAYHKRACRRGWWVVLLVAGGIGIGGALLQAVAAPAALPSQINPLRQESIKVAPVQDIQRQPIAPALSVGSSETANALSAEMPGAEAGAGLGYDPSGRRDPFAPVVQQLQLEKVDVNLPPLQRVNLTELNLIAIVWGAYGYTAMVQTPEGYGYTVRRGTRMGQNNGVVSAITERGIIVQERFTDVYGKKQEREYVKLLHPKEGVE